MLTARKVFDFLISHYEADATLYWAGIGSRRTPSGTLNLMTEVAHLCSENTNWIMRSGGAPGADLAFEMGSTRKEIFLPWKGFNGSRSSLYSHPNDQIAQEISAEYHPAWDRLPPAAKTLMGRNVYQVLGREFDTWSSFVLCWTPDGATKKTTKDTGGTGQAIRIASRCDIPVHNLGDTSWTNFIDWTA